MCKRCGGTGIILWEIPAEQADPIYRGSKARITMSKPCPECSRKETHIEKEKDWWAEV